MEGLEVLEHEALFLIAPFDYWNTAVCQVDIVLFFLIDYVNLFIWFFRWFLPKEWYRLHCFITFAFHIIYASVGLLQAYLLTRSLKTVHHIGLPFWSAAVWLLWVKTAMGQIFGSILLLCVGSLETAAHATAEVFLTEEGLSEGEFLVIKFWDFDAWVGWVTVDYAERLFGHYWCMLVVFFDAHFVVFDSRNHDLDGSDGCLEVLQGRRSGVFSHSIEALMWLKHACLMHGRT